MKKAYKKPCVKIVPLKRQFALLVSSDGEDMPPVREVGMSVLDKPDC
jgi:hypothetical protein